MSDSPPAGMSPPPGTPPSLTELFTSFAVVSVSSFGGALPWARRMIVEQRCWMTAEEFNETFSLAQFLPGPNLINFSVVYGSRLGGVAGAVMALAGLLGPPLVIVTILAALYAHYGDIAALTRILGGIASAAAGLLIASVVKMLEPMFRKWNFAPFVAIVGFIAVALIRWPLPIVFAVLAPISIALAWVTIRR
jgi:chromate transporter